MRILLTNDDGLETDGLKVLYHALETAFGRRSVTVISPFHQQSAVSHSITIFSPLFIEHIDGYLGNKSTVYAVRGTPADCIKLALGQLLKQRPEVIIAGINAGANLGVDVFYSGTVAAVLEGAFWGIPSFAISVEKPHGRQPDFKTPVRYAVEVIKSLLGAKLPASVAFNINIPNPGRGLPKGIKYTRQDIHFSADEFTRGVDPRGRHYYWMKEGKNRLTTNLPVPLARQTGHKRSTIKRTAPMSIGVVATKPGSCILPSDIETLRAGYISVTPLRTNLTDYQLLAYLPKHIAYL